MAFSGGTFVRLYNWGVEQATAPIETSKLDAQEEDIATGLSSCILRDGTGLPTANQDWNGKELTNVGRIQVGPIASGYPVDLRSNNGVACQIRLLSTGARDWKIGTNIAGTFELYDVTGTASVWTVDSTGQHMAYEPRYSVASLAKVTTYGTGSFTGTLTGVSGSVTATINWLRVGQRVTLYVDADLTGTSTSTSATITGLPAALYPAAVRQCPCLVTDVGVNLRLGAATVSAAGVITLMNASSGNADASGFTGSGVKGVTAGWSITYAL